MHTKIENIFPCRLSEPDEKDISHVLATVGLGAVSVLDLAFLVVVLSL